jgi:methyltransferase (TIGR00027 family)
VGEASRRLLEAAGILSPLGIKVFGRVKDYSLIFRYPFKAIPGQMFLLAVRKLFMEAEVRAALERGVQEVLVVGAGLDTLCLRLAKEYPAVLFLETDHPGTSLVKQAAIAKMGERRPNLQLVAVDLAQASLADVLDACPAWNAALPSITVAEGVLPYLRADDVDCFFSTIHAHSGPGSRVLVSHMSLDGKGKIYMGELGPIQIAILKFSGERIRSGMPDGNPRQFLQERGYRLDESVLKLRERFLVPAGWGTAPLTEAERLLAADKVDSGNGRNWLAPGRQDARPG